MARDKEVNHMAIPGFIAEVSLYRTSEHYKMVGAVEALAGGGAEVVPQACVNIGPCRVCVTFRAFPPQACISLRCPLGIGFSRCIP